MPDCKSLAIRRFYHGYNAFSGYERYEIVAISEAEIVNYTRILQKELQVALGCTEPIAIAYCSAYARKILGRKPERYEVYCSRNIIKNAKAVIVPNTGGLKGIEAAVLAGGIGGNPDVELRVLESLTDVERDEIRRELMKNVVQVRLLDKGHALHIIVHAFAGNDDASVEIVDSHARLGKITQNSEIIREHNGVNVPDQEPGVALSVANILEYANLVDLNDVRDCLERQLECNKAIASEGLRSVYGAGIGSILMKNAGNNFWAKAKAMAAAASDARMDGCPMPVVINSGSGNQGIAVSVPIWVYSQEMGVSKDLLLRALCVGNLIAIHQKTRIGKLSAFCGATCAAIGAVAGIAYINHEPFDVVAQSISNSLATIGGMICDGAKSSCAAKIALALEAASLGYKLAKHQRSFRNGEGIVRADIEETIKGVAYIASHGMQTTDDDILKIMLNN